MLRLLDFDYNLPKELIAQYPLRQRDSCRLMVLDRANRAIKHDTFKNLPCYLSAGDCLILNDTKVLRARIYGRRQTGAKVEILLVKRKEGLVFDAMIRPGRVKQGERIIFGAGSVFGEITGRNEIRFSAQDADSVYRLGAMPLPPYIKRDIEDSDEIYYQTVYAKEEGAIASPTAGLHFTEALMGGMRASGINFANITLHVGAGTFRPVKAEDITQHAMEPENFSVTEAAIESIKKARANKNRVIAVGTTSLRALETYAAKGLKQGQTNLFIYPGYEFKTTDCLLTNFHLPVTTLFMLVCAFCAVGASASGGAGIAFMKKAYQEAIEQRYRFYSYGDAMLII